MKDLHVKDWMTRRVITVDTRTSLPDAHKLMRTNNIRRLPVVDRGKLVGIVTRSDIREASPSEATTLSIWEMHYQLSKLSVGIIMTKDPYTVTPDTTIKDAAKMMYTYKIGGLPVVNEGGELQGIMTESDIFRILIAWFDEQEGTA
ncbi:MAG: CBS domain-containing protein [Caldilineae bacterium]|nr:CBS domain-containing protein [Anaerolineae bacterium]MCB0203619.1 CBS domain-containing protein [Anaerolineae bacterium]MCB0254604.1 CBS domain-containing protein [Anaerolineae bacterium]MCB9155077.1 CBS domain-containing protein [Caldilineae bacterium]